MKPLSEKRLKTFQDRILKTSYCWIWKGTVNKRWGYGYFRDGEKLQRAHRVSWFITHGELPRDTHVLHKCDNRLCVNPEHLYLGTQKDNMGDRKRRGKYHDQKGEMNYGAKLSTLTTKLIRRLWDKDKYTQVELAKKFNTDQSNISLIVNHKSRVYG